MIDESLGDYEMLKIILDNQLYVGNALICQSLEKTKVYG